MREGDETRGSTSHFTQWVALFSPALSRVQRSPAAITAPSRAEISHRLLRSAFPRPPAKGLPAHRALRSGAHEWPLFSGAAASGTSFLPCIYLIIWPKGRFVNSFKPRLRRASPPSFCLSGSFVSRQRFPKSGNVCLQRHTCGDFCSRAKKSHGLLEQSGKVTQVRYPHFDSVKRGPCPRGQRARATGTKVETAGYVSRRRFP